MKRARCEMLLMRDCTRILIERGGFLEKLSKDLLMSTRRYVYIVDRFCVYLVDTLRRAPRRNTPRYKFERVVHDKSSLLGNQ